MSAPTELSFDEILKFMLAHNGKVTNHELVKHFKAFLTNPDMRDQARTTFKKHVNTLAIIKNHNNEKWLILKKKYVPNNGKEKCDASADKPPDSPQIFEGVTSSEVDSNDHEAVPERPPLPLHLNQDLTLLNSIIQGYTAPPLEDSPSDIKENLIPDNEAPKVYPRRRSSADKIVNIEKQSSASPSGSRLSITTEDYFPSETLSTSKSEMMLVDNEQKISVKERKQMFNRMASEGDILKPHQVGNLNVQGCDEEDRASVVSSDHKVENDPLDSKQKAWILTASRPGEYHTLAKMCSENPKLAKLKDPFTTAMHWACKRGDENLVKMLAGVARSTVNDRSGYTPLHIAMQFRRENVYRLLVDVYDADPNMRDWSGRKPTQWIDTCKSPIEYRKSGCCDLRRTLTPATSITITPNTSAISSHSKKESFLRMGSLNVKVKKTTEAFSNFLGVGATRNSSYLPKSVRDVERRTSDDIDHIHKNWGSADSIPKDDKLMPPPLSNKVRRRGHNSKRGQTPQSRSTPSTPDQPRARIGSSDNGDSDSDSAAGFHSAWRKRSSNVV